MRRFAVLCVLALAACGGADTPATDAGAEAAFATADGITLGGRLFGGGETGVVLAHMRGAGKETWFDFATRLAQEGYLGLAFDFRGYGDSDGEQDTGLDVDIAAAVDFLRTRGTTRVFVLGASMGGTGALVAASRLELAGVASLSGPAHFERLDAAAAVRELDEPAVFIAAEGDDPYAADAQALRDTAGAAAWLELLPGGAHGTDLFGEHGDHVTALLLDFLDGADL